MPDGPTEAVLAQSAKVVDDYIAWAVEVGKIRTPLTEKSYRQALRLVATAIPVPLDELTEAVLRDYQHEQRYMKARSWNLRCSVISEVCGYLVTKSVRSSDPSHVLRRKSTAPRRAMDAGELEMLISGIADPETKALANLVRETGLTLPEVKQINVRPDRVPTRLHVRVRGGVEKEVAVTPAIRAALEELGGGFPHHVRTYQRAFEAAGFKARDLHELGPSRSLSLDELHPRISLDVRQLLLLGEIEMAAFTALREVEIRVRELAKAPDSLTSVNLMKHAFRPGGPLSDPSQEGGEREAVMALFWGGIGVFKNPSSHRRVQFADAVFAREVVMLADLLHRMLDEIARSLRLA